MSDPVFRPFPMIDHGEKPEFQPWTNGAHDARAPHDDAFVRGLAEGQAAAQAAFEAERSALHALVAAAAALQPVDLSGVAQLVVGEVERLVREIVGDMPVDRDWLEAQARQLLEDVEATSTAQLAAHPDDVALLADACLPVAIYADPALLQGTLRLEMANKLLEHGRAPALDAVRDALHRTEAGQ